MTSEQISKIFLKLFALNWRDSATDHGIKKLLSQVKERKQVIWWKLIKAWFFVFENDIPAVFTLLEGVIEKESANPFALLLKARILSNELGHHGEAIDIYDQILLQKVKNSNKNRQIRSQAQFFRGATYGKMKKFEEEIAVYDELIQSHGDDPELTIREQVASAMVNKGATYGKMKKFEEAIAVCDELIQSHGDDPELRDDPELTIREQVAKAFLGKAFSYVILSKKPQEILEILALVDDKINQIETKSKELAELATFAFSLRSSLLAGDDSTETEQAKAKAKESTKGHLSYNLKVILDSVFKYFDEEKRKDYFNRIDEAKARTDRFLMDESLFARESSFLLILRQWNSYTPTIPAIEEADRGGGYFIRHGGEGIIIDPGYDFIDNFYRAGGRMCDIDHIIVTHAHDDHTAEFEALLMLLHKYNERQKKENKKRVCLYLSIGAQRKFSGLLNLRDPKIKKFTTLVWAGSGSEQFVSINDKTTLYVLPAFHDDVITRDTSIGLGFILQVQDKKRRIVFTSDSGLYPRKYDRAGEPQYYDQNNSRPQLDTGPGKALYEQYPEALKLPDLLITHIGSIKEQEFGKPELFPDRQEGQWYYPNHLGMLGTLTMLHQIQPMVAIISEFGSELKGFVYELVHEIIGKALEERQEDDAPDGIKTFVIPGDLTIAYDISNGRLLRHDTCEFGDINQLTCRKGRGYKPKHDKGADEYDVDPLDLEECTYIFKKADNFSEEDDNKVTKQYFKKYCNNQLPFHAKK